MKIICIEEHFGDKDVAKAAGPVMMEEGPYMADAFLKQAVSAPAADHPSFVSMEEASALSLDIGEGRIKQMDENNIQMQVLSLGVPAQLVPSDQATALARAANDRLAKAIAANPERLSGFAALPWQNPAAAVDELTRAVHELGLKGVLIIGRPGDTFLDDPKYAPVLKRLHELKVPLSVHPYIPVPAVQKAYYDGFSPAVTAHFSLAGWGWHHEAGVDVLRMILAGIFERFPDLQVISGHWGEMVPFYLPRLDDAIPQKITGLSGSISEIYKRNVYVTPSGMFDPAQFEYCYKVLGADRIMWSGDYPYYTMNGTQDFLKKLPISDEDREKVAHGNVEKLLRL